MATEDWLYDEGEDQNKAVYVERLASLKVIITEKYSFQTL